MNNEITIYDNRATALNIRHYRVYPYYCPPEPEPSLHPAWIFVAIAVGLVLGNWIFG